MPDALTVAEMLDAEKSAIDSGCSEAQLLQAAGESLGHRIHQLYTTSGTAIAYLGKGNNAADSLVALKYLRDNHGWKIAYRAGFPLSKCNPLVREHVRALGDDKGLSQPVDPSQLSRPLLLLDALLGTGSKGAPRPPLDALVREIAKLRNESGAKVIAIDLPSGVDADSGEVNDCAVLADLTLMIANAKVGLLKARCSSHVGALGLIALKALEHGGNSGLELIAPQCLSIGKSPRPHEIHKGTAGRVRLLVGSNAYPGAAAMASMGALRGGAGLVFVHVPTRILETVRKQSPPEVIISGYEKLAEVPVAEVDARVIGCGLGSVSKEDWKHLESWITGSELPTVLDADGLNAIVAHQGHGLLSANHVITPHHGEFRRLAPDISELDRETAAREFSRCCLSTLLLKGHRSIIAQSTHSLRINSTGNAGMASGGQGDLLSGVIAAQLAAGLSPYDAASLGAWICGRAAELALLADPPQSEESLAASDCSHWLGQAWNDWKNGTR